MRQYAQETNCALWRLCDAASGRDVRPAIDELVSQAIAAERKRAAAPAAPVKKPAAVPAAQPPAPSEVRMASDGGSCSRAQENVLRRLPPSVAAAAAMRFSRHGSHRGSAPASPAPPQEVSAPHIGQEY